MLRTHASLVALAERTCRPQRVGLFGRRGAGKTTLLAMLYREAVGGRLADLRLAAGDPATAEYLSDKILQLEAGRTLPGTLAETDLHFHLYHRSIRIELLVKDYQGEHIELHREEPIREFLRDCDVVLLCVDAASVPHFAERLRYQQEVERLMEDYLALEPGRTMDRPVALLLTKADLLGANPSAGSAERCAKQLDMIRHALHTHCSHSAVFAVSSLGPSGGRAQGTPISQPAGSDGCLLPFGLAEPLCWLATTLQARDEARLERLFKDSAGHLALLGQCVQCFSRRYPDAPSAAGYRQRMRELKARRHRRLGLLGSLAAALLLIGFWTYDAVGYQQAFRFQAEHPDDPAAALGQWRTFRQWHPTRNLLRPDVAREEVERLAGLGQEARQQAAGLRLADLRRQADDPDADLEALGQQFRDFCAEYPDVKAGDQQALAARIRSRRSELAARRARRAYDDLATAEQGTSDLASLVGQADRYLRDYPGSAQEKEVRRRRASYLLRLDERDIESARDYSARKPHDFAGRRAHYQRYLDRHPAGGTFTGEATAALAAIAVQWDKHDFRAVRDRFLADPAAITRWSPPCRAYLAAHPDGKFTAAARGLLRWCEQVTTVGEYRVVLRDGHVDKSVARFFSRGPKLSVELEVNGVRYGPSSIVFNSYDPEWNYEFPRPIRWRLGDRVIVRVTEHSWKDRLVLEADDAEPLALRLLTGEVWIGENRLTFESDFAVPALPSIE